MKSQQNVLWIDDLRDPNDFINTWEYASVYWVDNYDAALLELNRDDYNIIHLDNDLSDPYDRQGKHLFNEIEYKLHNGDLKSLSVIIVHSDNSSAVHSIMTAKENMKDRYGVTLQQMIFKYNS